MILFPLGHDVFSGLGPDGLSIFYVSCIVSQLVYSCGGSVFKGGIGSEMVSFFFPFRPSPTPNSEKKKTPPHCLFIDLQLQIY